jgi:hypothetical protein
MEMRGIDEKRDIEHPPLTTARLRCTIFRGSAPSSMGGGMANTTKVDASMWKEMTGMHSPRSMVGAAFGIGGRNRKRASYSVPA